MIANNMILTLASLGLCQALLLCFYLVTLKKGNRKSNVLLALVLFGLTIRIGKSVLGYYIPLDAWQRNIGISGVFISGPCLWFYGISLFEKNKHFSNYNYLHLLPFLIFVSLIGIIPSDGEFAIFWNYGIIVFHLMIYLLLSSLYLIKNRFNASNETLGWYRNILIGIYFVWIHYLGNFLNITLYYIEGPLFYTFLIYAFSYLFLNRRNFILDKYGSSNLDKNASRDLFQKVKILFTEQRIFLEPGISISTVAEKLSISSRIVSQVINENEQQNFYEFVNHYRIENAKALLIDLKNLNEKIATIAFEAGFGTVTSFNVAFKKKTGMTPSEYRKQHVSS
jgi:AraC-like DNA-binding protein